MAGGALWLLLTVFGFLLIRSMGRIGNPTVQAITVRVAAFLFVAAGTVTTGGWVNSASDTGIRLANNAGNAATAQVVGASAIWILWLVICVAWVAGIVPESWFAWSIPDTLSVSGLFLPSLSALLPYGLGDFFGGLFGGIGRAMIQGANQLVGA